jgi:hypothetical protein
MVSDWSVDPMKKQPKKTPRCILPPNKVVKDKKKEKNKNKCREKIRPE